jgi:predicted acylesterase/phospholipase RssA
MLPNDPRRCTAGAGASRLEPGRLRRHNRGVSRLTLLAAALLVAGCAGAPVRRPLPPSLADAAVVPGMNADIRAWGDDPAGPLQDWRAPPDRPLQACCAGIIGRRHHYLVISSGGDDGAFGAGLLAGWTAAGTRPEFDLVTGVSTGALIAPLAFLGPDYDDQLREVYTQYSEDDMVERRGLAQALSGDAAFDTAPLRRLIDRYLGDEEVARIATEARKGRRLLVATTNLDAARPVVWDLTKIAASGAPGARQLIGDVILASCAVPGLFRPVLLDVAAGGELYDELHVDGGVTSQLFIGPHGFDWERAVVQLGVPDKPQVYVIRNARLRPIREAARNNLERTIAAVSRDPDGPPEWREVELKLTPILRRSLASMAREPGIEEVYRRYVVAYGDTLDFNFAHIPGDLDLDPSEFIDLDYMRELFTRGYEMARAGYPWIRGAP